MNYLSGTISNGLSNGSIGSILGMGSDGYTTQSDYLGGIVNFVDGWMDGISDMFAASNGLLLIILFVLLLGSVFISQSSQ